MALNTASLIDDVDTAVQAYIDTQVATLTDLVAAGTSGTTAGNAGTATTGARSDHVHRFFIGNGSRTTGAGTGNQAITGVGFKPTLVILTYATESANNNAVGFGAATSATTRWAVSTYDFLNGAEYEARTTSSTSLVIQLLTNTAGTQATADFVSLDSGGFTINWTAINNNVSFSYECWG